jgi:mannosyltransferase
VIAFGVLIAFGCVLRFLRLSDVGLWYDELWTVVGASNRPFFEMYREWILGDSHPPGLFLFYFAWFKLVPATEFWARLPSAIAGVLTVAYLLWGTQNVLTRDERLNTATFVSLSYIYVFYALSVKQYSAMLLFATVATIAYLQIVAARQVDRRAGITLATASMALAYLNHFGLVYAALLLALLLLTFRTDRAVQHRILRIVIACALAYAPVAPFLYLQIRYNIDAWQPYQIEAFLANLGPSFFFSDPPFVDRALAVLALVMLTRAVVEPRTRQQLWTIRNRHIAIMVVTLGGFMLVLGLFKPIFYVRYFLVMAPAVLLGIGIVTAAAFPLDRGWPAIVLLAFFLHGAATQFRSISALQREQWDKSVDFVLKSRAAGDAIYVLGANMDKTEFDYLREGNVDGVFNVRNLVFYRYYFRRRGAAAVAARLKVVLPTVTSVKELAARFHDTRATIYILAGHHLQYRGEALATLKRVTRRVEVTSMNSTLVYKVMF